MSALHAEIDRGLFFGHAPVPPGILFFRYVDWGLMENRLGGQTNILIDLEHVSALRQG